MNNLIRYYNQNRKKIWGIIIIIAFAFVILQLANELVKNKNQREVRQAQIQAEQQNTNEGNSNKTISSDVTNYDSSKRTKQSTATNTISEFLSYCNNKELDKAYEMLTDECKEQMFKDIETFERIYYNSTFENKYKNYSIEKWVNNTYIVTIRENALAVGKSTKETQKADYITTVEDNNNYKLNINSYIKHKKIEKVSENNEVKIEVLDNNTYMNYDEYKVRVTNNSNEEVLLDSLGSAQTLYIKDGKGNKYPSYNNELDKNILTVASGHTKEFNIRFYSSYISTKDIKSLVFSDITKKDSRFSINIEL